MSFTYFPLHYSRIFLVFSSRVFSPDSLLTAASPFSHGPIAHELWQRSRPVVTERGRSQYALISFLFRFSLLPSPPTGERGSQELAWEKERGRERELWLGLSTLFFFSFLLFSLGAPTDTWGFCCCMGCGGVVEARGCLRSAWKAW